MYLESRHSGGRFGSKEGQIGPKMDKSGTFFQIEPNIPKYDLKSPGFIPFGVNLTHFGATPTIPDLESRRN